MRWKLFCLLGLLVGLFSGHPVDARADSSQDRRPNIVFIYADDHAQAAIGAYGSAINQTPHINALARQGMRFSESFVANSICGPARATILTGLHSHANEKITNQAPFNDALPTWPKRMQAAGYQTAMLGKWHLPTTPNGFTYWAQTGGYYVTEATTSEGKRDWQGYTTDLITEQSLKWIDRRDPAKPFAIWISHSAAHRTWMPATRYLDLYRGRQIPEPRTLLDDFSGRSPAAGLTQMRIARDLFPAYDLKLPVTGTQILDGAALRRMSGMTPAQRAAWDAAYAPENEAFARANLTGDDLTRWKYQRYIQDYLRCVAALDESVGHVMQYLEVNGLADNTVVVYSSDQGFFLGEHGWYDKRWMYEPALRTPLIVKWPGVVKPGSVSDAMVQNIDMAPTFLAMADLEVPESMHGRSLVGLLQDQTPDDWRDAIYYHYQERGERRIEHRVAGHYGVRTDDHYKLIYVYDHDAWEFYDLEADPDEMHNLYGDSDYAEQIEELRSQLIELRETYGDTTGPDITL